MKLEGETEWRSDPIAAATHYMQAKSILVWIGLQKQFGEDSSEFDDLRENARVLAEWELTKLLGDIVAEPT